MVDFGMTDLLLTQQALYKMKIYIKSKRENHRIMGWFGLERTFKGHPAPSPEHLPLNQVVPNPVQRGLEHF